MAQTINTLTTWLTDVFNDMSKIKVSKGFMSLFGRPGFSMTEYVENATQISIDLIRGEKKISKILTRSPQEGGISLGNNVKNTTASKWQNVAYDFPIIREDGSITFSESLKYRVPGEVPVNGGGMTVERARYKAAEIIMTNYKRMCGAMEKMAMQSMTTGTITLDDAGSYDFNRSTDNTITPSTLWSVTATASPIGDIDDACDAVQENGKTEAMAGIMGYSALSAMLETDEIKNTADNRRFEFVMAGASRSLPGLPADMMYLEEYGFKYMAYLKTYKGRDVYLFTYNEKYQTDAGVWTDYMNPKDVLLFDHTARYDRYFGPMIRFDIELENERIVNQILGINSVRAGAINDIDATGVIDARMFHNDSWLAEDKTNIMLESYTGPLYVPTQIDAACLLDGVIA